MAWADADATIYTSGRGDSESLNLSFDDVGGVVGGGVEWAASQSIRMRAEGLYYWFDDDVNLFDACGAATSGGNDPCQANPGDKIEFKDIYVFRVGASYYFQAPAPVHTAMK